MKTVFDVVRTALGSRYLSATLPAHTMNSNPRLPQQLADASIPGTKMQGTGSTANPYRLVVVDREAAEAWMKSYEAMAAQLGMTLAA